MSHETSFRMELADTTETMLREIADPQMKQKDVALTYVLARASSHPTDWSKVNHAIIDRWSYSGLIRVKRMAQKIELEEKP